MADLDRMPDLPVKIMMNVGNPDRAFHFAALPSAGVGLARLEFIISNAIGVHPQALLEFDKLPADLQARIRAKMAGYPGPTEFYVARLTEGIASIAAAFAPLPVIGVVEPGARAAVTARPAARHLVLATEATVRLGAYGRAIRKLDPQASVQELACELMVAQAEEGWTRGDTATAIVREYLRPMISGPGAYRPESLILGCTHFPILGEVIRSVVDPQVSITDSAGTTAAVVAAKGKLKIFYLSRSGKPMEISADIDEPTQGFTADKNVKPKYKNIVKKVK